MIIWAWNIYSAEVTFGVEIKLFDIASLYKKTQNRTTTL